MRVVAIAGAAVLALGASSQGARFTAADPSQWRANGGSSNELRIAPGETVTFGYPSGSTFHTLSWTSDAKPSSCVGVPPANPSPGWEGSCRFDAPGTYAFQCDFHPGMEGRVIVQRPATSTPTPNPTAPPGATPTPSPEGGAGTQPAARTELKVRVAARQKGTRVRGSAQVSPAGSRLEVTARARGRRASGPVRRAAASGTVTFSIRLDARARRALRSRRTLVVTVVVALTPPSGAKVTRTAGTRLTLA